MMARPPGREVAHWQLTASEGHWHCRATCPSPEARANGHAGGTQGARERERRFPGSYPSRGKLHRRRHQPEAGSSDGPGPSVCGTSDGAMTETPGPPAEPPAAPGGH